MLISLSRPKRIVHKADIPLDMQQLRVLNPNSGATSVVLEKDDHTVYVLTRDGMKKEWLVSGLRLGTNVQELNFQNRRMGALGEEPVYCIEMPKLLPLSASNKKIVLRDIKQFQKIYQAQHAHQYREHKRGRVQSRDIVRYANDTTLNLLQDQYPDNVLIPYLEWAQNYDDYFNDIGPRNFMEDSKGSIVVLDPVVAYEVMTYLQGIKL